MTGHFPHLVPRQVSCVLAGIGCSLACVCACLCVRACVCLCVRGLHQHRPSNLQRLALTPFSVQLKITHSRNSCVYLFNSHLPLLPPSLPPLLSPLPPLAQYRRIDIYVTPYSEFPCMLLHFTGSGHFNRSMRSKADKLVRRYSSHVCTYIRRGDLF